MTAPNFYEILQISPRADLDTIHRVYRIMAARFHPDNPVSGDHERFLKLCEAYDVLSRPERRMQYDTALRAQESRPIPIFETRVFVDGLEGELNRRFGILALLYQRRRLNQSSLGISTLDLETWMALPREHLEFTLWYLRNKGYVQILEENSDYAVTTAGVDYVEANSAKNPILYELLTAGDAAARTAPASRNRVAARERSGGRGGIASAKPLSRTDKCGRRGPPSFAACLFREDAGGLVLTDRRTRRSVLLARLRIGAVDGLRVLTVVAGHDNPGGKIRQDADTGG